MPSYLVHGAPSGNGSLRLPDGRMGRCGVWMEELVRIKREKSSSWCSSCLPPQHRTLASFKLFMSLRRSSPLRNSTSWYRFSDLIGSSVVYAVGSYGLLLCRIPPGDRIYVNWRSQNLFRRSIYSLVLYTKRVVFYPYELTVGLSFLSYPESVFVTTYPHVT